MKTNELLDELYTSRWYLSTVIDKLEENTEMDFVKVKDTLSEGSLFLNNLLAKIDGEASLETHSDSIAGHSLWYPKAVQVKDIKLKTSGNYANNYPVGAIVHYTAGRYEKGQQSAKDSLAWARDEGYSFMIIAYDGTVLQATPLDKWGSHAGVSNWKGLGADVSNKLVGIEICNAGMLKKENGKYYSWFNTEIPGNQVKTITATNDNQMKGYYHKYSDAQEKSLIDLLVWLKTNNPAIFKTEYILGHDEVAGPKGIGYSRKQDPGGSLSMTMTDLRELVESKIV